MTETSVAGTVSVSPELKVLGDSIARLTLNQVIQLSNYLERITGVTDPGESAAPKQAEFDLILTEVSSKMGATKLLLRLFGLTLSQCKLCVDFPPQLIREKVPQSEAELLKREFETEGARVELRPITPRQPVE